jgi:hypothetical protein
MAELRFDPNKPHGTVHSDVNPIKFEQNGHHFTADGREYVPRPEDDPLAAYKAQLESDFDARVKTAVAAALAAQKK